MHNLTGEITAVLEFCEALMCSNVNAETIQHENKKANKKRVKKGKLPIYDTKILSIEVPVKTSRRQGYDKIEDRSSPRQHLRRGHIRRLSDGRNIWVNSCVVGSINTGRIDKDYHIFSAA